MASVDKELSKRTKAEVENRINYGYEHLTSQEFIQRLDNLGYRFSRSITSWTFISYYLSDPKNTFRQRGFYIVEKDTGISFAHYKDARRDKNFHALQHLRYNSVVYSNGYIWSY